jgi:uncharacterized protein with FMN-binding domain
VLGPLIGTALIIAARASVETPAGTPMAIDDTAEPAGAPAAPGAQPTGGAPARSGAAAAPRPSTVRATSTPSRAAPPAGGLRDGTHAGRASSNQYGTIQVTITVQGGRMTAVNVSYPTTPSKTAEINARAIPRLRQSALAAQSASVATVSGATVTSLSFVASLRSALTAAKA